MTFQNLLLETITVESFEGSDGYGGPVFGLPQTYRARIQSGSRKILKSTGEEILSNVTIYLDAKGGISPKDRVTLPARFDPQQPEILRIDTPQNSKAIHHTVIYA